MQHFMEIGPVVFAGEYLGIKIGCSSYNTSKPVVDLRDFSLFQRFFNLNQLSARDFGLLTFFFSVLGPTRKPTHKQFRITIFHYINNKAHKANDASSCLITNMKTINHDRIQYQGLMADSFAIHVKKEPFSVNFSKTLMVIIFIFFFTF